MSRVRPDGTELRWKLAGLEQMLGRGLPFFIQWDADAADQPGATPVEHPSGASGIEWVEVSCDEEVLRGRLGNADADVRAVGGSGGVSRAGIGTPAGTLVLS